MTRQEMTLIFGQMLLAWPSAPMFQGGIRQLGPTINLWAVSLPDVDFWTGKQAVCRVANESHFPPSIGDFSKAAGWITRNLADRAALSYNMNVYLDQELGRFDYNKLAPNGIVRKSIDLAGGPENFTEEGYIEAFQEIYKREHDLLPALQPPSAPGVGPGQNIGLRQIGVRRPDDLCVPQFQKSGQGGAGAGGAPAGTASAGGKALP